MAFLNQDTNELHLKIVFTGGVGSGKTTNLQSLYKQTSVDVPTRFFDLHGLTQPTQLFDFVPLAYGEIRAHALRLHLYTLPAHDVWPSTLMTLLWGIDGLVHVVDSRIPFLSENERQLNRIRAMLTLVNRSFSEIPLVYQFNHRDATNALSISALRAAFSRRGAGSIEAVAVQDIGVLETLDAIANRVLMSMESANERAAVPEEMGVQ